MEIHFHLTITDDSYPTLKGRLETACVHNAPWAFLATVQYFLTRQGWYCEPWF